jgi:short-subunit dehydrogenase
MANGNGLTALVTGASAGIGKAFAEVFAKNGFDVILTARREERLRALATELEGKYRIKASVVAMDLADPTGAERLVAEIKTSGLKVDALVNNAGYGVPGNYAGSSWKAYRLLPDMVTRKKGYIINIASVAGMIPGSAGATLYGASKSFMVQFSRSLHLEQEANGVHVTAVCPGFTYSEFHDVTGNREQVSKMPEFMWMTAEAVAQQGFDAVMRNKAVHVNGPVNKGIVLLAKYLPDQIGLMIVRARSRDFRAQ